MDAILDLSDPKHPKEPEWPEADFIVGNPPFLGGKLLRTHLGDQYVQALFQVWDGSVPREADLCCYWFVRGQNQIDRKKCKRVGLLATQGVRGGANRKVLERIKRNGEIFFAESDRDWVLEGAAVHVSMVAFDNGDETLRVLDGRRVSKISANLSGGVDTTDARRLKSNAHIAFMGITPSGPFVVDDNHARDLLLHPNPHRRPNSDVVRPWLNGADITRRFSFNWIIDLSNINDEVDASRYEAPFQIVKERVTEARKNYRTGGNTFWKFERSRPEMRMAIAGKHRFLGRSMVGKHQFFIWLTSECLPANLVIVIAAEDYHLFGVLHSRPHEVWGLKLGTRLETRPRYTPTTCFETFPFPEPTDEQRAAIAEAAKELDTLRNNWLNPQEWTREELLEFPGSVDGPWARYVHDADDRGIGVVRYPRLAPKDEACAKQLKRRTLTSLYNERPTWLDIAHRRLDEAVSAAYGWPADLSDDAILEKLLQLNLQRAAAESK